MVESIERKSKIVSFCFCVIEGKRWTFVAEWRGEQWCIDESAASSCNGQQQWRQEGESESSVVKSKDTISLRVLDICKLSCQNMICESKTTAPSCVVESTNLVASYLSPMRQVKLVDAIVSNFCNFENERILQLPAIVATVKSKSSFSTTLWSLCKKRCYRGGENESENEIEREARDGGGGGGGGGGEMTIDLLGKNGSVASARILSRSANDRAKEWKRMSTRVTG